MSQFILRFTSGLETRSLECRSFEEATDELERILHTKQFESGYVINTLSSFALVTAALVGDQIQWS